MDRDSSSSDRFAHVLSRLRYSLFDDTFDPPQATSTQAANDLGANDLQETHVLSAVTQHGGTFMEERTAGIHATYAARLETIDNLLASHLQSLHGSEAFDLLESGFDAKIACATNKLDAEADLFDRRLAQQFDTATNRLKELIFECAGEMDKTQRRLLALEERQCARTSDGRVNGDTDRQKWATLLARMREDVLEDAEFKDLSGQALKQAVRLIAEELDEGEMARFVARVDRLPFESFRRSLQAERSSRSGKAGTSKSSTVVLKCRSDDRADVDQFLTMLCLSEPNVKQVQTSRVADSAQVTRPFSRRLPLGTRELPLYPASTFLGSTVFGWLSAELQVVDPRVYYCVDERAYNHSHFQERQPLDESCKTHHAAVVARAIDEVYCPEPCSRFSQAVLLRDEDQEQWTVSKVQARHRDLVPHGISKELTHDIRSFPDVLVSAAADGHGFFFAAARVHELLETNRFGKWNQRFLEADERTLLRRVYSLSEPGVLRKLYMVCKTPACRVLLPIPEQCMDELIATYVVRKPRLQTSIAKVMRDLKHDLVLFKPPNQPTGLLVALSSPARLTLGHEQQLSTTLSNKLCAWRACLCRCSSATKTDTLCKFHSDMRRRLSKVTATTNEVKRHLPRNGGVLKLRKVSDILKASSLMSELLNGKLEKTIDGFCAKAANAARPKAKRESKESSGSSGLASSTEQLRTEINLCSRVLRVERRVAEELQNFASAGIFPADELAQIRQEYTALNEERTALARSQDPFTQEERKRVLPCLDRKHLAKNSSLPKASPTNAGKGGRHVRTKLGRSQRALSEGERQKQEKKYLLKDFSRIMEENESDRSEQDMRYVITKELPLDRVRAETELELEFCLRKLMILKESNVHPNSKLNEEEKRDPIRGRTPMRFDSNGYPLPVHTKDSH